MTLFLHILADAGLILSSFLVLFGLIAWWGWLFKSFGTF
jgi:hypothetical protein